MDTISYFTKKNCRNLPTFLSVILLAIMAFMAFVGGFGTAGIAAGLFFGGMAILTAAYMLGQPVGCTLIQIPLILLSFLTFFMGLAMSALGILIVRYVDTETYVNSILNRYHFIFTCAPRMEGTILCAAALTLFFITFLSFSAISYLSTVKSCLNDIISRRGARVFSVCSIISAVATAAGAVLFLVSHGGPEPVLSDTAPSSFCGIIALMAVLLLLTGLSANSFIKTTYAFKVFEEQVMKVETNADGTMYSPIKEDSDTPDQPIPVPLPKPTPSAAGNKGKKKKKDFIKPLSSLESTDVIDGSHNEYDII